MSKRNITILGVLSVILIALSGVAYWYYAQQAQTPGGDILFPGESGVTTGGGDTTETPTTPGDEFTPGVGTTPPRLYQLHTSPVAGVGFFETKDNKGVVTDSAIRYIERGLGHVFETQLSTYVESRIVNETRSRISEALWGGGGAGVVVRFIDSKNGDLIKTRIINIEGSEKSDSAGFLPTEEIYLPDAIPFMATAEDGSNNLFYLEGEDGFSSTFKNTGVSKIFGSAFTEWLPQFPNEKLVTLTTRPSADIPGHLFFLNTTTNAVTKILGNINGLTTLTNSDGKSVLFSESINNVPELFLYDTVQQISIPLYLQTLPEKCVWGKKEPELIYCAIPQTLPRASYPDQWYQGLVSFSDAVWEINSTTFRTKKIFSPSDFNTPSLDIVNLSISAEDDFLTFIDKSSETPWVYSIIEPQPLSVTEVAPETTGTTSNPSSFITSDMEQLK